MAEERRNRTKTLLEFNGGDRESSSDPMPDDGGEDLSSGESGKVRY